MSDTNRPVHPTERLSAREQKSQSLHLGGTTLKRCKSVALSSEERLASLRCRSGQGVSTSASNNSNQPESNGSNAEEPAKPTRHAHERSSSWMRMFLTLPLELATVTARTDKFYLRKRKRKHWWSREHFPTVCSHYAKNSHNICLRMCKVTPGDTTCLLSCAFAHNVLQ